MIFTCSLDGYEKLRDSVKSMHNCLQMLAPAPATPLALSLHSEIVSATRKLVSAVEEYECIIRELSESCNTGGYQSAIPSVLCIGLAFNF